MGPRFGRGMRNAARHSAVLMRCLSSLLAGWLAWPVAAMGMRTVSLPAATDEPLRPLCHGMQRMAAPLQDYRVVAHYPHDPKAFTQGLVLVAGELYESTGLYGRSGLRRVQTRSGRVLARHQVEARLFAEGLTAVGAELIQATWKAGIGLRYRMPDLTPAGHFRLPGEVWGLAYVDGRLVVSDGSPWLRFLDADDYHPVGSVQVRDGGRPVTGLNELEAVPGALLANVYPGDCVARIDPATGEVRSWIDLSSLWPWSQRPHTTAVANGLAWDAGNGTLLVTGKYWPWVYRLRLGSPVSGPFARQGAEREHEHGTGMQGN